MKFIEKTVARVFAKSELVASAVNFRVDSPENLRRKSAYSIATHSSETQRRRERERAAHDSEIYFRSGPSS